ncbi:MAG: methyltransferase domain-containing protein, partial [Alphaproteobacteria bacterium]|nr:methyltransferase domain-containing protein [Alphaproteobacteria bacterium]
TIPDIYEDHLGPLLFHYYAEDLARRVATGNGGRVLETACGTGISTKFLREALPDDVAIVATDLSDAMLDVARERRGDLANVTYKQANALELDFEDDSFDAVVCQFGLMFFPDKLAGLKEAARVLKPDGQLHFNVWDSMEFNPIAQVAFDTGAQFFDGEPAAFIKMPFGYHAIDPIKDLLHQAGLNNIQVNVVPTISERPSAHHVAEGLVAGNPTILELRERGNASVEVVIDAMTAAVSKAFGDNPVRTPLQAIVFSASR